MYAYEADLWCDECGANLRAELGAPPPDPDTDQYPVWAPDDIEADCPQHCAGCHVFLENPLTSEGYAYVAQALEDGTGDAAVLAEWASFYGFSVYDVTSHFDVWGNAEDGYEVNYSTTVGRIALREGGTSDDILQAMHTAGYLTDYGLDSSEVVWGDGLLFSIDEDDGRPLFSLAKVDADEAEAAV